MQCDHIPAKRMVLEVMHTLALFCTVIAAPTLTYFDPKYTRDGQSGGIP